MKNANFSVLERNVNRRSLLLVAPALVMAVTLMIGNQTFADESGYRVVLENVPGADEIGAGNIQAGIKMLEDQLNQVDQMSNGDIWSTLCAAYILDDSVNQSERACTKAVEVDPTNHALNNRGVFRLSKGDLSGARKDFERVRTPDVEAYLKGLKTTDVRLVAASNYDLVTLGNPLGVTMPDEDRQGLVQLLEQYDVALIEDDVYGDLRFDGSRPVPAQFLGGKAQIFTCGSFSKTAASGYRIGWVVSCQSISEIARLKRAFSCSSGFLQQLTLADFLASGDYARHLKALVPVLKRNSERMQAMVAEHFPSETRTSRPVGGSVLWLELPKKVNAENLFDDAIAAGISIAPGHIFSPCSCYTNFVRLSFGHPWNEKTEGAIRWLGERVAQLSAGADKS